MDENDSNQQRQQHPFSQSVNCEFRYRANDVACVREHGIGRGM